MLQERTFQTPQRMRAVNLAYVVDAAQQRIELVEDKATKAPLTGEKLGQLMGYVLSHGVLMVPCGRYTNHALAHDFAFVAVQGAGHYRRRSGCTLSNDRLCVSHWINMLNYGETAKPGGKKSIFKLAQLNPLKVLDMLPLAPLASSRSPA